MPFKDTFALLGLLSVIPLIILYLIRPKPREMLFPSIRFLEAGDPKRSASLSRLITDPLFWIQLIVLVSLSIAAAGPFTESPGNPGTHLAIVLDVSASMENTFPKTLQIVDEESGKYDRISIILAGSVPSMLLREGSKAEALAAIGGLQTRDVIADLSAALMAASTVIGPEGGDILVISDFISWTGDDPDSTRRLLEAGGRSVVFSDTGGGGDNVGIVGGWVQDSSDGLELNCTARLHNYGGPRQVGIAVSGPGGKTSQSAFMDTDSDYYLSFLAAPGETTVSIDSADAIKADNTAYIYAPLRQPATVLYLGDSGPALAALQAIKNVYVRRDGSMEGSDIVVVSKNASIGVSLNSYIDAGGNVVYLASGYNDSPQYLPVRITGESKGTSVLWARDPGFAEGIHFEEIGVTSYLNAAPRRQSTTMVEVNGNPALSYWTVGRGRVVYDGLEMTDFSQRPEYPIFWYRMVNWLTGAPDARDLNKKTGEVVHFSDPRTVRGPRGTEVTSTLLLDKAGFYHLDGTAIAANLYDPRESDLSGGTVYEAGQFRPGTGTQKMIEKDLSGWLIFLALLMIALEFAIIRWRREV